MASAVIEMVQPGRHQVGEPATHCTLEQLAKGQRIPLGSSTQPAIGDSQYVALRRDGTTVDRDQVAR
jgi:hypothetical protein